MCTLYNDVMYLWQTPHLAVTPYASGTGNMRFQANFQTNKLNSICLDVFFAGSLFKLGPNNFILKTYICAFINIIIFRHLELEIASNE